MDSLRLTCGFVLCRPVPLSVRGNCYLIENRTSLELARYNQCTCTFTYRHSFKVAGARRPVHFQVYKRLLTRWLHLQYNGNNFFFYKIRRKYSHSVTVPDYCRYFQQFLQKLSFTSYVENHVRIYNCALADDMKFQHSFKITRWTVITFNIKLWMDIFCNNGNKFVFSDYDL